jgi:voltage-gated sodium channel
MTSIVTRPLEPLQHRLRVWVESKVFFRVVITLILINAVILGLETYPAIMAQYGTQLLLLDRLIIWLFVIELALRFAAYGIRFFRDPWNLFDCAVVAIAFLPANQAFAVLRAARVLRVLRLISVFPRLRRVVEGLIGAIPGIGSIGAILILVFYIFAVMATKLFGATHPEWFGTLHHSFFSLFQVMTLEGWPDIVRSVKETHPYAWLFFIPYILIATFTVLNLFIAVIVDAMQRQHQAEEQAEYDAIARIEQQIITLHAKLDALRKNMHQSAP